VGTDADPDAAKDTGWQDLQNNGFPESPLKNPEKSTYH
jgi:hypothetical protein